MSGTPKRLKTVDILPVCELHGCTLDDLETVLDIETVVYPFIVAAAKENQERR